MQNRCKTAIWMALLLPVVVLCVSCGGAEAPTDGEDEAAEVADAVDEEGMATGVTEEEMRGTCQLLTDEDIAEVIGVEPVGEAVEQEGAVGATFPSCSWSLPGPDEGIMAGEDATLQLIVLTAEAYERRRLDAASLSGTEPVEGVGEDAWVQISGSQVPNLYVLADGTALAFIHFLVFPQGVEVTEEQRQEGIDAQAELARRALQRM